MTVKPDSRTSRAASVAMVESPPDRSFVGSPLLQGASALLPPGALRFASTAPGRISLFGGIADYAGAAAVGYTLEEHVCVVVQPQAQPVISLYWASHARGEGRAVVQVPLSGLVETNGEPNADGACGALLKDGKEVWRRALVGAYAELAREGRGQFEPKGVAMAAASTLSGLHDAGEDAAFAAAAVSALAAAFGLDPDASEQARLCQRVLNQWLGLPIGIGDAETVVSGRANHLMQIHRHSKGGTRAVRLPGGIKLIGLDCGVLADDAVARYAHARTSAFMGCELIRRIIEHGGGRKVDWEGLLSKVPLADYIEKFRDRIPTKMKGADFLNRFGETSDALTRIDPSEVYKVRSRTEHPIYEHERALRFPVILETVSGEPAQETLVELRELMFASHWSYGQRCGLGNVQADLLVGLIRKQSMDSGIIGAKITGRGCGGLVAVLMREGAGADSVLEQAVDLYESKTGFTVTSLRSCGDGAFIRGVQRLS